MINFETIAIYRTLGGWDYGFPNCKDWKPVDLNSPSIKESHLHIYSKNIIDYIEKNAKNFVKELNLDHTEKLNLISLENILDPKALEEDL